MRTRSNSSRLKSPNRDRRKTLGPVPTSSAKNRIDVVDVPVDRSNKPRASRASMLPRVGRENAVNVNSPGGPSVMHASKESTRRESLGGVPKASRASMMPRGARENAFESPTRASVIKSTTESSRRKSLGGSSVRNKQRRQTIAPQATSYVVPRDPRNIHDKGFQQHSMKRLLNWLTAKGYDHPISLKTLKLPSGKDFSTILTFMMRRLDPEFQKGDMKFEDEVAASLKFMSYPFPVSKTALVSAGSPHTWPNLLALLTWLMDQLEAIESERFEDETTNEEETTVYETVDELENKSDKAFFKFLAGSYTAFINCDDAALEEVEGLFAERCERDNAFLAQEVERLTDVNATILEQIDAGSDQSEEIQVLVKKREDYASDLEQFQDLIKQMQENKLAFVNKIEERQKSLDAANSRIERLSNTIDELERRIAEQELSLEDAKKLEVERKSHTEARERVLNKRKELSTELSRHESDVAALIDTVDDAVSRYNAKISDMSVVPLVGHIYGALKAELHKDNLLQADQSSMVGVDLCGEVQETVQSHQPEVDRRTKEKARTYQDSLDDLQNLDNVKKEAMVKLNILERELTKLNDTLQQEQVAHEAKVTVRQREVDAMKDKVGSLRDPVALEEQMASFELQCAELEALQVRHKEENINQKQNVLKAISDACSLMEEHDVFVRRISAEVKDYWAQKKASLREVTARD